jgi:hypothetical protein
MAALIGLGLGNRFLAFLSPVSGFVFMVARVLIGLSLLRRPAFEAWELIQSPATTLPRTISPLLIVWYHFCNL